MMAIGDYLRLRAKLEAGAETCGGTFGPCQQCVDTHLFIVEAEKLREAAKDAYDEGYADGGTDMEEELGRDARDPDADRPIELNTLHAFFTALHRYVGYREGHETGHTAHTTSLLYTISACKEQLLTALEVDARVATEHALRVAHDGLKAQSTE